MKRDRKETRSGSVIKKGKGKEKRRLGKGEGGAGKRGKEEKGK